METNVINMSVVIIATFISSFFVLKYVTYWFNENKLVDIPDERKLHRAPRPTSGGVIFVIPFMLGFFTSHVGHFELYTLAAFLTLTAVGFTDDRLDLSAKIKLLIQLIIGGFYVLFFGGMTFFENDLGFSEIQSNILTVIFIVGVINAFNLIDGSDGLSGLYALISFIIFAVYALYIGEGGLAIFSLLISCTLIVFLIFNWSPAKIFMGDSGSLAIGFALVIFGIKLCNNSSPKVIPFEAILFPMLAFPVIDTLRVMSWRLKLKKNPFKADRTHFHHLLQFLKLKPRFIALVYSVISAFVMISSIISYQTSQSLIKALFLSFFVALMIFVIVLFLVKIKQKKILNSNRNKMTLISNNNRLLHKSLST
jgi:UDP-GlcNAc:undecaprenyl-phosphate GlcNAc-1-phosphate transferase